MTNTEVTKTLDELQAITSRAMHMTERLVRMTHRDMWEEEERMALLSLVQEHQRLRKTLYPWLDPFTLDLYKRLWLAEIRCMRRKLQEAGYNT